MGLGRVFPKAKSRRGGSNRVLSYGPALRGSAYALSCWEALLHLELCCASDGSARGLVPALGPVLCLFSDPFSPSVYSWFGTPGLVPGLLAQWLE